MTMVRLAHFSVKEYLVSDRIRTGSAAFFSIDEEASNAVIGATGLACLQLYDEALIPSSKEFFRLQDILPSFGMITSARQVAWRI